MEEEFRGTSDLWMREYGEELKPLRSYDVPARHVTHPRTVGAVDQAQPLTSH